MNNIASQDNYRMKKLTEVRPGWYRVSIHIHISALGCLPHCDSIGGISEADRNITRELHAESGADAYNQLVEYIKSSPNELVYYEGCICTVNSWSEMDSKGYEYTFLGENPNE